ncbi:hypothetical protein DFQ28_004412 [Apophysomyces sp. BC1034]|nr:hypothetical protein DFQ28_004412 [Apophysomyces sp. BC1034]
MVALALIALYGVLSGAADRIDGMARAAAAGEQALEIIVAHARLAGMPQLFPLPLPEADEEREPGGGSGDPVNEPIVHSSVPLSIFGCDRATSRHDQGGQRATVKRDSDSVTFRYAADAIATWTSKHGRPIDCLGQNVAGDTVVVRFHVGSQSATDAPELYCRGNGHNGPPQPLVGGIEQLRLSYWLVGADAPVRASSISDSDWRRVTAIDICVVARGPAAVRPMAYLDCDGNSVLPGDRRVRIALARRVAIRNIAREAAG